MLKSLELSKEYQQILDRVSAGAGDTSSNDLITIVLTEAGSEDKALSAKGECHHEHDPKTF